MARTYRLGPRATRSHPFWTIIPATQERSREQGCAESAPPAFRIARRGTSREINRQIALNLVRSRQPISRADLARLMGVRRGAISRLVKDLLRAKQVFEGAEGREQARPQAPASLHRDAPALRDGRGHQREPHADARDRPARPPAARRSRSSRRGAPRRGSSRTWRGTSSALLAEHPEFGECLGVGIVVAGLVDLERGRLRNAPTLGWRDVDLQEPLREAIGLPVVVENDVKACVLAQVWAVRGYAPVDGPVVFVNASDGVGVGIALDGQLLRGAHNNAGEFGHIALSMDGPLLRLRTEGMLGGLRLGPGHRRPLHAEPTPRGPHPRRRATSRSRRSSRARARGRPGRSRRCARRATTWAAASRRS